MNWICPNCSNSNGDDQKNCFVCGEECPKELSVKGKSEKLKSFLTRFDALKISVRGFFSKLFSGKKEKKPHTKKAEPEKSIYSMRSKEAEKPKLDSAFAPPWPEHHISFDEGVIEKKGFVRSERETLSGVDGYRFYRADGSSNFIRAEMAIVQKMAVKV